MPTVGFPLEGGGQILVRVQPENQFGRVATRGSRELAGEAVEEAEHSFDSALSAIHLIAERVFDQLRALATPPTEVRVQFGLEFDAKAGAVVASASATAQLDVDLTWHQSDPSSHDPDNTKYKSG